MKRIGIIVLAAVLTATCAAAGYSPQTDYMAEMLSAVCAGDYAAGSEAAARRAEKKRKSRTRRSCLRRKSANSAQ